MKRITAVLVAVLCYVQYSLWLGEGSLAETWKMRDALASKKATNDAMAEENERLAVRAHDVRYDLSVIEGLARSELDFVKPGETLYKITQH